MALTLPHPLRAALSPAEQRVVAAVESQLGDLATELEAAVRIDSATENLAGVRQLADHFAARLRPLGFTCRFEELPAEMNRAGSLVAEHPGKHGRRVLLLGHLDTVYPGGTFRREGDIAHGSGVADMKGGDVIMLMALRALHAAGELKDAQITVVMTGDEEAHGQPVSVSRRALFEAAAHSDLVLCFESAVGRTATVARRGNSGWELEVQGATGHSSLIFSAAIGDGAVFETARILQEFRSQLSTMDGVTINPGLILGGAEAEISRAGGQATGKRNIVAQRVLVRGDLRTVSAEQLAEAQARMHKVLETPLRRTTATLTFGEAYPAMPPTPANYALLAQLDQASRDLGLGEITAFDPKARGAGDIAFISPPLAGLDGLGLDGPGQHTPNESADLRQAPDLIKRAALFIHRLTR